MKLTSSKLKQIIKKELRRLHENLPDEKPDVGPSAQRWLFPEPDTGEEMAREDKYELNRVILKGFFFNLPFDDAFSYDEFIRRYIEEWKESVKDVPVEELTQEGFGHACELIKLLQKYYTAATHAEKKLNTEVEKLNIPPDEFGGTDLPCEERDYLQEEKSHMKLTKSKLKQLIRETLELVEAENEIPDEDKRRKLDATIAELGEYNVLMGQLRKLFGWDDLLEMLRKWEDKTHQYYKDLEKFARIYQIDALDADYAAAAEEETEEVEAEVEKEEDAY